jgi:hypothetical protein
MKPFQAEIADRFGVGYRFTHGCLLGAALPAS